MSSQNPQNPDGLTDSLRRLESLPPSTAGTLGDLTPLVSGSEEPVRPASPWPRYALIGGGVVLLAALFWLVFGGPELKTSVDRNTATESNLDAARTSLGESGDLGTCRVAISQFNAELARDKDLKSPKLSDERRKQLGATLALSDDALNEIDSPVFSKLDAAHLEQCLLFRDAGRTLEPSNLPGISTSALRERWLDRVRLAFDWAVRQIRLEQETERQRRIDPLTLPPGFTLRRGVGSPLERALVFLAVLEQIGPPEKVRGCLIFCPEKADAEPTLWACGVQIDGRDDLYLFDPRLGLPLPGKDGIASVATLAAVVKDSTLLKPLSDVGPYTPQADQVSKAEVRLVVSLSALAPRMDFLQDRLLGSAVPVRLAQDLEANQKAFETAARAAGLSSKVTYWSEGKRQMRNAEIDLVGAELLRRFLPEDQGGSDRAQFLTLRAETQWEFLYAPPGAQVAPRPVPRLPVWQLSIVPFRYYPGDFTDPVRFPRGSGLSERTYAMFAGSFIKAQFDSNQPRDQILRGRFTQALPALIVEREDMVKGRAALDRAKQNRAEFGKRLEDWIDAATAAHAEQIRASESGNRTAQAAANRAIDAIWARGDAVLTLLVGSLATPRLSQVTLQVAMCKQEVAELAQMRLDLARILKVELAESEKLSAQQSWRDALTWWARYASEKGEGMDAAAVRRLRARALSCVGGESEAINLLRDATPPMLPLDQLAGAYLANAAKK